MIAGSYAQAPLVTTRDPGYVLELAPERVDAHRFEMLVQGARADLARGDTQGAVETLRALWRGEAVTLDSGSTLRTYPAPVQRELPLWLTASSGRATFEEAGRRGCSVLTGYLGLDRAALAEGIALYRKAFTASETERTPHVTLMVHACVAETVAAALAAAEQPLISYQEQFLDLSDRAGYPYGDITDEEKHDLARYAAHKYATERGLIGDAATAGDRLRDLAAIGVDEVACLVDFGLSRTQVSETLTRLAGVA